MTGYALTDDFAKAAGYVALTANFALKDAHTVINRAGFFSRGRTKRDLSLAVDFCQLLLTPFNEHGAELVKSRTLAESYCRNTLSRAYCYCQQSMKTYDLGNGPVKRLVYIQGLLEIGTHQFLTKETSESCWYGESLPLMKEMEHYLGF